MRSTGRAKNVKTNQSKCGDHRVGVLLSPLGAGELCRGERYSKWSESRETGRRVALDGSIVNDRRTDIRATADARGKTATFGNTKHSLRPDRSLLNESRTNARP